MSRLVASMLRRVGPYLPSPPSACDGLLGRGRPGTGPPLPPSAATRPHPCQGHRFLSSLAPAPEPSAPSTTSTALSATPAHLAELADETRCLAELRTAVQLAAGAQFATYQDGEAFEADTGVRVAAFTALQNKLGHVWTHPWLLRSALTHISWKAESGPTGTQPLLAWVGDAALQGIVTDELVARYAASGSRAPTQLSVTRSLISSRAGCARHARKLGLDATDEGTRMLVVGASFQGTGSDLSVGMLGECFEAVLGSVYIDGGRAAARAAFLRLLPFPPTLPEVTEMYGAAAGGGGKKKE